MNPYLGAEAKLFSRLPRTEESSPNSRASAHFPIQLIFSFSAKQPSVNKVQIPERVTVCKSYATRSSTGCQRLIICKHQPSEWCKQITFL